MPALAKAPVRLPRFVPHIHSGAGAGAGTGADTGAGAFSRLPSAPQPQPVSSLALCAQAAALPTESPDHLAHDARNILSGLMLYSELLAAPGVLAKQHGHYAQDLQGIVKDAIQIVERMAATQPPASTSEVQAFPTTSPTATPVSLPTVPVTDAAETLRQLQPLLSAIAGPAIRLSIATMPCVGHTALAVEDLTRVLVNLVRNAADAMPAGGRIRITAQYGDGLSFLDAGPIAPFPPRSVLIAVADNGPGIPAAMREQVFDLGFTTRKTAADWPAPRRRGLGLSIVRNLVQAVSGEVRVTPAQPRGARFEISLPLVQTAGEPITSGTCPNPLNSAFAADSSVQGCIECQ
ncbi:MAG: sensor histidine kinase [Silvibacterium sp.]